MCQYKYTNMKLQKLTVSILVKGKTTANTYGDIIEPNVRNFKNTKIL